MILFSFNIDSIFQSRFVTISRMNLVHVILKLCIFYSCQHVPNYVTLHSVFVSIVNCLTNLTSKKDSQINVNVNKSNVSKDLSLDISLKKFTHICILIFCLVSSKLFDITHYLTGRDMSCACISFLVIRH